MVEEVLSKTANLNLYSLADMPSYSGDSITASSLEVAVSSHSLLMNLTGDSNNPQGLGWIWIALATAAVVLTYVRIRNYFDSSRAQYEQILDGGGDP